MKVEFKSSFARDLKGIKDDDLLKRVKIAVEAIEKIDSLTKIPNLKKLKGGGNFYRLRVGDYRLGLVFETQPLCTESA